MGKTYKDPIYGYIDIDDYLNNNVIDTAIFQRLRDVQQTSYTPLYTSSVHNRFVHSIGVYYLGCMAVESLKESEGYDKAKNKIKDIDKCLEVFKSACLLHDVGHAPFSHTVEDFFLTNKNRNELHKVLAEVTADEHLLNDIKNKGYKAAPHEIMSAIVAIKEFPQIIEEEYRSFFARCITGYKYTSDLDNRFGFLNCLISLLNSTVIDVDRIDYLNRDSYMSGFDTVKIDYERLLKNIVLFYTKDSGYVLCYDKAALSVIENAVYAHDNEKKWIQSHPVVLYESFLLQNIVEQIIREAFSSTIIPIEALGVEGFNSDRFNRVRLFSDGDIIYLMKNLTDCKYVDEFFDRRKRKHPIWKSEAEFNAIFEENTHNITDELTAVLDMLRLLGMPPAINKESIEKVEEEICLTEAEKSDASVIEGIDDILLAKKKHLEWMRIWQEFATNSHIPFDFLFINPKSFTSDFSKDDIEGVLISFPKMKIPCKFGSVTNVLKSGKSRDMTFFFVYYNRDNNKKDIDLKVLVKRLNSFFEEKWAEEKFV